MAAAPIQQRLRTVRQGRGWSQVELARRSGVSRAEVSAIETGRLGSPSVGAALRLASALGVPVEELFELPGSEAPPWAWGPGQGPAWWAEVGGQPFRYPLEPTARGALAQDRSLGQRTVVVAGCDPTVAILADELQRSHGVRLLPLTRSSSESLELLAAGKVHFAGVHVGDNARAARRALGKGNAALAHVARWSSGLAVDPAARVRSVGAAVRGRLRWVSRPEGSGARKSLDRVIAAEAGTRLPRLDRAARDHQAVAATIRSGWAQLGPCLELVARQSGLDFLGIEDQDYELVTRADLLGDPVVQALQRSLRAPRVRHALAELPGIDAAAIGAAQRA